MTRLLTLTVAALALSACRPVVVVDRDGNIVDLPPGVQLDVVGVTEDECDHMGGHFVEPDTCQDRDF